MFKFCILCIFVTMYIDVVPNRNSPPAILLRKAYRQDGKVKKKTIANLSDWPEELVENFRKILKGAIAIHPDDLLTIESSAAHGGVEAVLGTIKNIGLDYLISSKPCRESKLVTGMIAAQLLQPSSKLGHIRLFPTSTLADELGIADADEDGLYSAMDWLYHRKERIQKKLAKKNINKGEHALYDITSSYYEGSTCSLAEFGYNRDGKKGKKIIVYGMLTNARGCPVAVSVYPGNTSDSITVPDQVEKLRKDFELDQVVLVGDRGMLTQTQIENIRQYPGIGWITAMGYQAVRDLSLSEDLQLSLFDKSNIAEFTSEQYPGERLIACHNPFMEEKRKHKRNSLLEATEKDLEKISKEVSRRKNKPLTSQQIGIKVGKVINKHKMGKHFEIAIRDGYFNYTRNQASIDQETGLDGIYIIRTNQPVEHLSKEDVVRNYKNLSQVEQLFRSIKGMDVLVRPIRHRAEQRVKAHIFICMLAYYVEWHMRKALAPMLFDDEELEENKKTQDAVLPAVVSDGAKQKKSKRKTTDGLQVHSFRTLLANLNTRTRNLCRFQNATLYRTTELNPLQRKAFELLKIRTQ